MLDSKDDKSFEKKLENAKYHLGFLSDPEASLEISIEHYKNGILALKEARELLENAKIEIQNIDLENLE